MRLPFAKMEGLGNDYVYINGFEHHISNPSQMSQDVAERHFGVGSDGLIIVAPSKVADVAMIMYNADGSRSAMCGNGLRSVAHLAAHLWRVIEPAATFRIEAGHDLVSVGSLDLKGGDDHRAIVEVTMPGPRFDATDIPVDHTMGEPFMIKLGSQSIPAFPVGMGNPHLVVFIQSMQTLNRLPINQWGSQLELDSRFPEHANIEFVQVLDRHAIRQRTWERGSGETLACGSGAAAATVISIREGLTQSPVRVDLNGGSLHVEWDRSRNVIVQTGPSTLSFDGHLVLRESWGIKPGPHQEKSDA